MLPIPENTKVLILKPFTEGDLPFLQTLYASTRITELSLVDWNHKQKKQFINMQFEMQHQHYQEYYPSGKFDIIWDKEIPIGRLYIEEWSNQFRIIDIALLPQFCGQGIGSHLLKEIMQQANDLQKNVSIHVEQNNPALRLYQRLGFEKISEQGVYHLMEWQPTLFNAGKEANDTTIKG